MKPVLYMMMGLPGAGKTTVAKIIESHTNAVRLSSDEVRLQLWPNPTFSESEHDELYQHLNEETGKLLKLGKSVIYDANLNRFIHRKEKYDIAHKLEIETKLLVIKTPVNIAHHRSVEDAEGKENRVFGNLPDKTFQRLKTEIEWPSDDEPSIEIDGTDVSPEYITRILEI